MKHQIIRTLLIGAGLLIAAPATFARDVCDVGTPAAGAREAMAPWDFLIGPHEVDVRLWQDGAWGEPVATAEWNGWWGLGGFAIIDEWFGPARPDGTPGNDGVNVRVWDGENQAWRMTWQQTRGADAAIFESAIREDGFMHMRQVSPPEEAETDAWFEITGDDSWQRFQKVRDEDGDWVNQFRLDATRLPCGD